MTEEDTLARNTRVSQSQDDDIYLRYPESDFQSVMQDVLASHSEESFCFLNEGSLRARSRFFDEHFLPEYEHRAVAYAMKANSRPRILEILIEEGMRVFDCASIGEINKVLAVSKKCSQCVDPMFNNPIKRRCNIEEALQLGVNKLTVQSRAEIEKILDCSAVNPELEIMLRLQTLNQGAGINLSEKFGADLASAKEILSFLKENYPQIIRSLAINIGSQNPDPAVFPKFAQVIRELISEYGDFATINLGGGMPVNYHEHENFDLAHYLKIVSAAVRKHLDSQLEAGSQIVIEPGRAMIAEAVDSVIPILAIEQRGGYDCVYIYDGLFTSFSDAAIHGWEYNFRAVRQDGTEVNEEKKPFILYGRTCDSGDVIKKAYLPKDISAGDFLWLRNAGAYMDVQGSTFNEFPLPKYISYN